MKKWIVSVIGAAAMLGASPAFAGQWKFEPRRCPDLVDSRYDNRGHPGYDNRGPQRRDARGYNSRQAPRITICPRSSFVYVPDRRDRYDRHDRRPQLRLPFDRRMGMNYTTWQGQRVYIR